MQEEEAKRFRENAKVKFFALLKELNIDEKTLMKRAV
jgi:hypothetical protein